jgi:hypothetical protein
MLKLERSSDGERTTLRLIGRVRWEHLAGITAEMRGKEPNSSIARPTSKSGSTAKENDHERASGPRVAGARCPLKAVSGTTSEHP